MLFRALANPKPDSIHGTAHGVSQETPCLCPKTWVGTICLWIIALWLPATLLVPAVPLLLLAQPAPAVPQVQMDPQVLVDPQLLVDRQAPEVHSFGRWPFFYRYLRSLL